MFACVTKRYDFSIDFLLGNEIVSNDLVNDRGMGGVVKPQQ